MGTQFTVHLEESLHLIQDLVEVTSLVTIRGSESITVHRVRLPHNLVPGVFYSTDNVRQDGADAVVAHTGNHRQAAWHAVRIELLSVCNSFIWGNAWANLETNWVSDKCCEVHVEIFQPAGALTDPHLVCGQVIKLGLTAAVLGQTQHRTLIVLEQCFMRTVNSRCTQGLIRNTTCVHEVQAVFDLTSQSLITSSCARGLHELTVPLMQAVKVRSA